MSIKMTYKDGTEYIIKGVKEFGIDLIENVMYYTVDEVYFVGRMPVRKWPLVNIKRIKPIEDKEVKA